MTALAIVTVGLFVIAIAVVVVLVFSKRDHHQLDQTAVQPITPFANVGAQQQPTFSTPPAAEQREERARPADRFKRKLRDGRALHQDPVTILIAAAAEFDEFLDEEDLLQGAVDAGFTAQELAPYLSARGYTAEQVVAFIHGHYTAISAEEWYALVLPLSADKTPDAVASVMVKGIGQYLEEQDEDEDYQWDTFASQFIAMGCSPQAVAKVLFDDADQTFAAALNALPEGQRDNVDLAIAFAAATDVDLADQDTYNELRQDDQFSFEDMAKILHGRGTSVGDVISLESNECEIDDVPDLITTFRNAGYSLSETFSGLVESDAIDTSLGSLIQIMLDEHVPIVEIATFLREEERDASEIKTEV